MWELTVYELRPWESLVHITKFGRFRDLDDCMYLYSVVMAEIAKSDLLGTYIPMCVKAALQ